MRLSPGIRAQEEVLYHTGSTPRNRLRTAHGTPIQTPAWREHPLCLQQREEAGGPSGWRPGTQGEDKGESAESRTTVRTQKTKGTPDRQKGRKSQEGGEKTLQHLYLGP